MCQHKETKHKNQDKVKTQILDLTEMIEDPIVHPPQNVEIKRGNATETQQHH